MFNTGNSDSGSMLSEMIKSKSKLHNAMKTKNGMQNSHPSAVTPKSKTGHNEEFAGSVADNNVKTEIEFKIPKQELPEATKRSNVDIGRCSAPPLDGDSNLKRHRKK